MINNSLFTAPADVSFQLQLTAREAIALLTILCGRLIVLKLSRRLGIRSFCWGEFQRTRFISKSRKCVAKLEFGSMMTLLSSTLAKIKLSKLFSTTFFANYCAAEQKKKVSFGNLIENIFHSPISSASKESIIIKAYQRRKPRHQLNYLISIHSTSL